MTAASATLSYTYPLTYTMKHTNPRSIQRSAAPSKSHLDVDHPRELQLDGGELLLVLRPELGHVVQVHLLAEALLHRPCCPALCVVWCRGRWISPGRFDREGMMLDDRSSGRVWGGGGGGIGSTRTFQRPPRPAPQSCDPAPRPAPSAWATHHCRPPRRLLGPPPSSVCGCVDVQVGVLSVAASRMGRKRGGQDAVNVKGLGHSVSRGLWCYGGLDWIGLFGPKGVGRIIIIMIIITSQHAAAAGARLLSRDDVRVCVFRG
jgi:hypothetical protein